MKIIFIDMMPTNYAYTGVVEVDGEKYDFKYCPENAIPEPDKIYLSPVGHPNWFEDFFGKEKTEEVKKFVSEEIDKADKNFN